MTQDRDLEAQFLESVAAGDFETVELVADDYARIVELVRQYAGFPLGVTDGRCGGLASFPGWSGLAGLLVLLDGVTALLGRPRGTCASNLIQQCCT